MRTIVYLGMVAVIISFALRSVLSCIEIGTDFVSISQCLLSCGAITVAIYGYYSGAIKSTIVGIFTLIFTNRETA